MHRILFFFTFILLFSSLTACHQKQSGHSITTDFNRKPQKNYQAKKENFLDDVSTLTQYMMQSSTFVKTQNTPTLVIGKITNTTGDDAFPINKIEDSMTKVIKKSHKTEILPFGTPEFDYTTHLILGYEKTRENDEKQNNKETQNPIYTIKIQLLNYYGELIDQWSTQ